MVQDEDEVRQQLGGLAGGLQLVREDQQVVHQPPGVRLALHLVADAHQVPAAGQFPHRREGVGDPGGGEIGPADDPGDEVTGLGQGQELRCLPGQGDGLDQHGGGDAGGPCLGFEVGEGEVAAQRCEFGSGDPVLVANGQVPHMVVRVDDPRAGLLGRHSAHATGSEASAPSDE
ncbi:hypothetical protein OG496_11065 [Streptomyces sp. NBC_00988]|nr:hypothetical protein OG496_11065 [Streptomyces sp. NBC_00988]